MDLFGNCTPEERHKKVEHLRVGHHLGSENQKARVKAIWLLAKGKSITYLENNDEVLGKKYNRRTIYHWIALYKKFGFEGLINKVSPGNRRLLTEEQVNFIIEKLQTSRPPTRIKFIFKYWTVNHLKKLIEKEFSVLFKRDESYRRLLKLAGFVAIRNDGKKTYSYIVASKNAQWKYRKGKTLARKKYLDNLLSDES
ncbi:helix-turn-helix domain containing protein [Candidatus Woesebacteria bacterium]|nr:helix-turn-helix domain containing protein [Candidatus Woesebacteria bacterium]